MGVPRRKWLFGGLLLAVVGGVLCWFFGRGYGEVSHEGYRYALALYSACNRQSAEHVQRIVHKLEAARGRSELDAREYRWLRNITDRALSGDWEAASQSIRQLMEDQIKAAPRAMDLSLKRETRNRRHLADTFQPTGSLT